MQLLTHQIKFLWPIFLLGSVPVHQAGASVLSSVNQIIVFGDSLSDNGNAAILQGGTVPGDYSPNAYTDGPNTSPATSGPFGLWIDQFAALAGLPDPKPFLSTLPNNTNFAIASAQTGPGEPQDISNQVGIFLLSSFLLSTPAPSNALYAIWGGANDILDGTTSGVAAADNLYSDILNLAGDGAKYFLWLDLPALGNIPIGQGAGSASLNAQSIDFDNEWAVDISKLDTAGLDVIGLDVYAEFNAIEANPAAFGFTNVTDPAQNTDGNPNTYLFWDQEHPTTAANALIAQEAYDAVAAAPEAGSLPLLVSGVAPVAILIWLRRRFFDINSSGGLKLSTSRKRTTESFSSQDPGREKVFIPKAVLTGFASQFAKSLELF